MIGAEVLHRVEVEVMEDPEALAQRRAEHAGPGGGADQGEGPERDTHGAGVEPLVDHEVDREILHRRVEQLLHRAGQAVDLVDEQHVVLAEIGEDAHQVGAALEGRARGDRDGRAHLVGHDGGERRLAESGGPRQQDVVEGLAALAGRLHRHAQALHGRLLAHVLVERCGRSCRSNCVSSGSADPARHPRRRRVMRAQRSAPRAAVDLVEELLRRRDAGPPRQRAGDELRRLARAVAELLDEDLQDHRPEPLVVGGRGRGRRGASEPRARPGRGRTSPPCPGAGRRCSWPSGGRSPACAAGSSSSCRAMAAAISPTGAASERAATSGPTSFTVISFSKNSLSRSDVNPMRTGRGWLWVAW